jgi:signal transduction histidine kinase/phage shock protein PspC (stress-responsive transcriptional regulator)
MPSSRWSIPRVPRSSDRIVAGVAGGWADRWAVEPTVVRTALGLLSLVGGLGVVLYGLGALASTPPMPVAPPTPMRRDRRRELAIAAGTAAVLVLARAIGLWPGDAIMVPATLVAAGVAVAWTPRRGAGRLAPGVVRVLQVVAGAALLIAGVASLADRTGGLASVGASAGAIAVVVGGLAMFAAPAIGRLLRTLDDERATRIREDERARVAAHLHDSVLQTLALIQKNAGDEHQVARLARSQERELRAWMFETTTPDSTLSAALKAAAADVEDAHGVPVELVTVGDTPMDDTLRALVDATREAIVNAAKHAGAPTVDVYAEVAPSGVAVFVRDRGRGFDPDEVAPDRLGVRRSIVDRMARHGGRAEVRSSPGQGTEVRLEVPGREQAGGS